MSASRCSASTALRSISGAPRRCSTVSTTAPTNCSNDVGLSEFAEHAGGRDALRAQARPEIATTLALDPEMMLLDEPMAGMGHEDIDKIAALIKRISAKYTILMVEHNLSVVANLSDVITVLTRGQVLAQGNYADLSKDERVKEAYLGAGHA